MATTSDEILKKLYSKLASVGPATAAKPKRGLMTANIMPSRRKAAEDTPMSSTDYVTDFVTRLAEQVPSMDRTATARLYDPVSTDAETLYASYSTPLHRLYKMNSGNEDISNLNVRSSGDDERSSYLDELTGKAEEVSYNIPSSWDEFVSTFKSALRGEYTNTDTEEEPMVEDVGERQGPPLGLMVRPEDAKRIETEAINADTEFPPEEPRDPLKELPFINEGSRFRDALKQREASSYNTMFGNAEISDTPFKGTKLTSMTVDEVLKLVEPGGKWNKYNIDNHDENTTAVGAYQIVGSTLRDLKRVGAMKRLGITGDDLFNRETQDALATELAKRRVKESNSMEDARIGMRNEWAGFNKLADEELDAVIEEIRMGLYPTRPKPRP